MGQISITPTQSKTLTSTITNTPNLEGLNFTVTFFDGNLNVVGTPVQNVHDLAIATDNDFSVELTGYSQTTFNQIKWVIYNFTGVMNQGYYDPWNNGVQVNITQYPVIPLNSTSDSYFFVLPPNGGSAMTSPTNTTGNDDGESSSVCIGATLYGTDGSIVDLWTTVDLNISPVYVGD